MLELFCRALLLVAEEGVLLAFRGVEVVVRFEPLVPAGGELAAALPRGNVALAVLLFASSSWAQSATVLQMQALQQSMAANQQRLRQYQWIEVRQGRLCSKASTSTQR